MRTTFREGGQQVLCRKIFSWFKDLSWRWRMRTKHNYTAFNPHFANNLRKNHKRMKIYKKPLRTLLNGRASNSSYLYLLITLWLDTSRKTSWISRPGETIMSKDILSSILIQPLWSSRMRWGMSMKTTSKPSVLVIS